MSICLYNRSFSQISRKDHRSNQIKDKSNNNQIHIARETIQIFSCKCHIQEKIYELLLLQMFHFENYTHSSCWVHNVAPLMYRINTSFLRGITSSLAKQISFSFINYSLVNCVCIKKKNEALHLYQVSITPLFN